MPNIRPINKNKYQISKHRFYELYHFCLQYNEWKEELANRCDTVKSIEPSAAMAARTNAVSDPTANLSIRRAELAQKCELIEETARETDKGLYRYILQAVTNEGVTYNYLRNVMGMPCGKNMYYNRRRKFYWLLSKKA
ncbi:MAG: hypothetical protein NC092_04595 [Butyrivibrio sp.]|nr:hypothetical protein [Muribaculum sp.]MCM1551953.1 hypothetical protein [Butyrivibrio sp.]